MKPLTAMTGGLAGATALTALHEVTRKIDRKAPRMELLGMQAMSRLTKKPITSKKNYDQLYNRALVADLITNTLFYSLVGLGNKKGAPLRGGLLGATAGVAGIVLPKMLGMADSASSRTTRTKVMTVALYTLGGLVAAGVMSYMERRRQRKLQEAEAQHYREAANNVAPVSVSAF